MPLTLFGKKTVDALSFTSEIRELCETLNRKIEQVSDDDSKTIRLPLNTVRVQINLIKEAIKNRNNRRKQLEFLSDFGLASYGEEQVIRNLCKKFHLVQVPETGQPLKDPHVGWDYHVHDNLSEGRKTPSQVLLDAFERVPSFLVVLATWNCSELTFLFIVCDTSLFLMFFHRIVKITRLRHPFYLRLILLHKVKFDCFLMRHRSTQSIFCL